jgi:hypothetical protein
MPRQFPLDAAPLIGRRGYTELYAHETQKKSRQTPDPTLLSRRSEAKTDDVQ